MDLAPFHVRAAIFHLKMIANVRRAELADLEHRLFHATSIEEARALREAIKVTRAAICSAELI